MKCRICKSNTDAQFNIDLKAVPICEECANAITIQQVHWLCTALWVERKVRLKPNHKAERRGKLVSEIKSMRARGLSLREVGRLLGISHETVRQLSALHPEAGAPDTRDVELDADIKQQGLDS